MNHNSLKRVAGTINIVAAAVFLGIGIRNDRTAFLVIGAFFLVIGILRLRQSRSVPPG